MKKIPIYLALLFTIVAAEQKRLILNNYDGGLNTVKDNYEINYDESQIRKNVVTDEGGFRSRKGFISIDKSSWPVSGKFCIDLWDLVKTNGEAFLIGQWEDELYATANNTKWVRIKTGIDYNGGFLRAETHNDRKYFTDGLGYPFYWSGDLEQQCSSLTFLPQFFDFVSHNGSLVGIGAYQFQKHVFYTSPFADATSEANWNLNENFKTLGYNDGSSLACGVSHRGDLYIYEEGRTWGLFGQNPATWDRQRINDEYGCKFPDTIRNIKGNMMFLSNKGIVEQSGPYIRSGADDKIRNIFEESSTQTGDTAFFRIDSADQWRAGKSTGITTHGNSIELKTHNHVWNSSETWSMSSSATWTNIDLGDGLKLFNKNKTSTGSVVTSDIISGRYFRKWSETSDDVFERNVSIDSPSQIVDSGPGRHNTQGSIAIPPYPTRVQEVPLGPHHATEANYDEFLFFFLSHTTSTIIEKVLLKLTTKFDGEIMEESGIEWTAGLAWGQKQTSGLSSTSPGVAQPPEQAEVSITFKFTMQYFNDQTATFDDSETKVVTKTANKAGWQKVSQYSAGEQVTMIVYRNIPFEEELSNTMDFTIEDLYIPNVENWRIKIEYIPVYPDRTDLFMYNPTIAEFYQAELYSQLDYTPDYESVGYYQTTATLFTTDYNVEWATFTATAYSNYKVKGTSIHFRSRSSEDGLAWSSLLPIVNNGKIQNPAGKYLQIFSTFTALLSSWTPKLTEMQVSARASSGTYLSKKFNASKIAAWDYFIASSKSNGQTVLFSTKTASSSAALDSASTGTISSGDKISAPNTDDWIQIGIYMKTTDGAVTPVVTAVTMRYIPTYAQTNPVAITIKDRYIVSVTTTLGGTKNDRTLIRDRSGAWTDYTWSPSAFADLQGRYYMADNSRYKIYELNVSTPTDDDVYFQWKYKWGMMDFREPNYKKIFEPAYFVVEKGTRTTGTTIRHPSGYETIDFKYTLEDSTVTITQTIRKDGKGTLMQKLSIADGSPVGLFEPSIESTSTAKVHSLTLYWDQEKVLP